MKLLIFCFLLALLLPYGAQLRTRYAPRPALIPVVRRWAFVGPRRMVQITYVRLG